MLHEHVFCNAKHGGKTKQCVRAGDTSVTTWKVGFLSFGPQAYFDTAQHKQHVAHTELFYSFNW